MPNQLQIIESISLLYELSLASGKSLDFNKNCESFLQVLMSRKNLIFASIWLTNDFLEQGDADGLTLMYANPENKVLELNIQKTHPIWERIQKEKKFSIKRDEADFEKFTQENISNADYLAVFALSDIGFLKTYSTNKNTTDLNREFAQLRNVLAKFTISIQACFAHKKLQEAKAAQEQREKERIKLLEELEYTNQELKDFAYIVSHDLKAPLRAIRSLAGWIEEDYSDVLDEMGREQLQLLQSRAVRMHLFIEGILEYSRIGRVDGSWQLFDLSLSIKNVLEMLNPPPSVILKMPKEFPQLYGEQIRIEQVFMNIISNAIKYNDKPQGVIEIRYEKQGDFTYFEIEDNGPGIEEKYFQRIFQLFQTLQSREEVESTGIGLTIVKRIVELHGGTITVKSTVGKGTTMCFTLPNVNKNEITQ